MLAGPGQLFPVKWTFLGSRSSKKVSNDNVVDEQDVSSLAFFAKHRLENRLFKIRTFCFGWIFDDFDFLTKTLKNLIF